MSPDATCNFVQAGEYNGRDYARRLDGAYFIWWDVGGRWIINTELGNLFGGMWTRIDPNIEGLYEPEPPNTGDATVAAGEH